MLLSACSKGFPTFPAHLRMQVDVLGGQVTVDGDETQLVGLYVGNLQSQLFGSLWCSC